MKISKAHQRLSDKLNNPEVLTNPELFLGPNWETVLRFWLYYESLTFAQRDELRCRYDTIDYNTGDCAWDLANKTTIEVIGGYNRRAVQCVAPYLSLTHELIAMHLLFERGHSLTFVPLVNNL
jgi:hypothetical protein